MEPGQLHCCDSSESVLTLITLRSDMLPEQRLWRGRLQGCQGKRCTKRMKTRSVQLDHLAREWQTITPSGEGRPMTTDDVHPVSFLLAINLHSSPCRQSITGQGCLQLLHPSSLHGTLINGTQWTIGFEVDLRPLTLIQSKFPLPLPRRASRQHDSGVTLVS